MARPDTKQFKNLLDSAHSVAILLPSHPGFDAVAAALSLKLSLDSSGKPTTVACSDPVTVEFHRLVAADSIVSNFGSKNLVITFPGQTEIVDKISYSLDDHGELNLVITPKADTPGIDYRRLSLQPAEPRPIFSFSLATRVCLHSIRLKPRNTAWMILFYPNLPPKSRPTCVCR